MKKTIPMLQTSQVKYLFPGADGTADCNSKSENSELTSIETSIFITKYNPLGNSIQSVNFGESIKKGLDLVIESTPVFYNRKPDRFEPTRMSSVQYFIWNRKTSLNFSKTQEIFKYFGSLFFSFMEYGIYNGIISQAMRSSSRLV